MNIKRILALFLLITVMVIPAINAGAEAVDTADVDNSSQIASISGTIDTASPTAITVTVLNLGFGASDLADMNSDAFATAVKYYRQVTTDNKGKYSLNFKMSGGSGEYPVIINYSGNDDSAFQAATLEYYSLADIDAVLASVNSAASSGEVKEIIESKYKYLSIDISYYNDLLPESKASAMSAFFDEKEALSHGFAKPEDAANSFMAQTVFYRICELSEAEDILELIEEHKAKLGITELNAYAEWQKLSEADKLSVCQIIGGNNSMSDIDDLCICFSEEVVLQAINSLTNWSGLKSVIKQNKGILSGINLSDYLSFTDTSYIDMLVTDKKYTTLSDFCTAVNNAISQYNSKAPATPYNGNKGKGTVGGGSIPAYVPDSSANLSAAPSENDNDLPFTDMESAAWAKAAVTYLYNAGIINGKTSVTFAPNDMVTREEFAKMLVEAFAVADSSSASQFTDVDLAMWYAPYVASASANGIVLGMGDGSFGVGKAITRQDMCVMIYRATAGSGKYVAAQTTLPFADTGDISDYALDSISALYANSFVNGMGNDMFLPLENTTRAQAAQIIYQFIK